MAVAAVTSFGDTGFTGTQVKVIVQVAYFGADVPGRFEKRELEVDFDPTTSLAVIGAAITAAIQTDASAHGYTVAAGATLLPTFQKL